MASVPDVLRRLRYLLQVAGVPDPATAAVKDLRSTLHEAVNGYAGLQVVLIHTGQPIVLTLLEPLSLRGVTSVRIPLALLTPSHDPDGRTVFYSSVAGALVDLAADLAFALPRPTGSADSVTLDIDLPAPAASEFSGWQELLIINRAAGLLIDQGHDPDTAQETLRRGATASGLTIYAFAAQLLQ